MNDKVQETDAPVAIAFDGGYSETKVVPSEGKPFAFPSTVAFHEDDVPTDIDGSLQHSSILVDGAERFVGLPRQRRYALPITADHSLSSGYLALVGEALRRVGRTQVSQLMLGLPSTQYRTELRKKLEEAFCRTINVDGVDYHIASVDVLIQPLGTVAAMLKERPALAAEMLDHLVVDPGHGTTDLERVTPDMSLRSDAAMSSSTAVSTVWNTMADLIDVPADPDRLAALVKQGTMIYSARGKEVDLATPFREAVTETAAKLIGEIKSRAGDLDEIGNLFLTGGFATHLEPFFRTAFPNLTVAVPKDPRFANTRGWAALASLPATS